MKRLWKLEQLQGMELELTNEVIKSMEESINIMNEEYGNDRNIYTELGGFLVLLELEADVEELRNKNLKDIMPEYTDEIISENGVSYYASLFLLSSDYSLMIYSNKKLHELLLGKVL
jgi:hypothetical protein